MTEISAALVKQLRDMTGSGVMNCKKALVECDGEIEKAVDWLRKKGLATAAKKAGRVTSEGIVSVKTDRLSGVILETNAETDFVARNDKFKEFTVKITDLMFANKFKSVDELSASEYEPGVSVKDKLTELISVIGENLIIRRLDRVEVKNGLVASYVHNTIMPGFGKIGVLLAIESDCSNTDDLALLGKHISMHIAASQTLLALSADDIDPAVVQRERDIFSEQSRQSGKPEAIIEKMVDGRIQKFYKESVLLDQQFFIEPDKTIAELLAQFAKDHNCSTSISKYIRYVLGEGIEKETVDFATEVQNQLKQ